MKDIQNNLNNDEIKRIETKEILLSKELESKKYQEKQNKKYEKLGIILIILCNLFRALNSIQNKYIQKHFPIQFHYVSFLFIRAFTILFFATFSCFYYNERILRWKEIKSKLHFFLRTNINFFQMITFTISIRYLRVSTANIIRSLNPILDVIFSSILLKEKFYQRYFYGCFICILGSLIIILNEHKDNNSADKNIEKNTRIIIGILGGSISTLLTTSLEISNKILVKEKIPFTTQMMYVAFSTLFYSIIYLVFTFNIHLNFHYILWCSFHGVLFYAANYCFNTGIKYMDLSKTATFSFSKIVFVYILGTVCVGEKIYLSDVIGSIMIISYLLYDMYYPLKK